jgi:Fe/S biogenesis protein NfuA
MKDIKFSTNAISYFKELVKNEKKGTNIRICVEHGGTPDANVLINYCYINQNKITDLIYEFDVLKIYIEKNSLPWLSDAKIDFSKNDLDVKLNIKAPNLKGKLINKDNLLIEKIRFFVHNEINPSLQVHKGYIKIKSLNSNNDLYILFQGGCKGCGMAEFTLKQGIEKKIFKTFPEVKKIIDITDHASGENPYFT